ncbi:MAG: Nif3-like dinuclear metal center hexameric protein [Oligoflexia bacterium]|nr:Nif3-like dinuclear metal center hexameric protein [Oligoflexia bacterium]
MSQKSLSQIVSALEARAPSSTAESWDNVGLLVGDPDWKTSGAVISIDLNPEAIAEAKRRKYRLIVNHHPCIFPRGRGLSRILAGEDKTGFVFEAIRQGIAVAAYHTNFDKCALEVVQAAAQGLGVRPEGRLLDKPSGSLVKLSVFVPASHLEAVRTALCASGAGHIGRYDSCTFGTEGEGTFRGDHATKPFLGVPGILEKARETRLETVFPRGMEQRVLKALFAAHPYEEVAFDLYPVEQEPAGKGLVSGLGYGFWGDFPRPKPFSDLLKGVKSLFKLNGFLLTEPTSRLKKVRRVGFVAGKGDSFIPAAAAAGCDVFITGEADYHMALDGARRGMAVLELGHTESERFFLSTMKSWVSAQKLGAVALDLQAQRILHRGGQLK